MSEKTKIKVPPYEELDDYEKELCSSTDPADHTALLIRVALKQAGVDPDGDDWWITGQQFMYGGDDIKVEDVPLRMKPRMVKTPKVEIPFYPISVLTQDKPRSVTRPQIKLVHTVEPTKDRSFAPAKMKGSLELTGIDWATGEGDYSVEQEFGVGPDGKPILTGCGVKPKCKLCEPKDWPKFQSLNQYSVKIKGRGTVFTVNMNDWLRDRIENKGNFKGQYVEIDGEAYILKGVEYSKGLSMGDIAGLRVMKIPLVYDMQPGISRSLLHDDLLEGFIEEACKKIGVEPAEYTGVAIRTFRKWAQSSKHVLKHLNEDKLVEWFVACVQQFIHTDKLAEEARQWDKGELKPTDPGWEDVLSGGRRSEGDEE